MTYDNSAPYGALLQFDPLGRVEAKSGGRYGPNMPTMTFSVERLNPPTGEGELGFSGGWVVICREAGQPDRRVGPAHALSRDAEAEAQRLRKEAAKDA